MRRAVTPVLALAVCLGAPAAPAPAAKKKHAKLLPVPWHLTGGGIGARSVQAQSTGGQVVVAVIDTGVDLQHPDLQPNLWVNPRELPDNGRDDDGNGFVDDVHGIDLVDRDGLPQDEHGHGTHVAGVIAARRNSAGGVVGVAPGARILAIRALDRTATADVADIAEGLDHAVRLGARIVNISANTGDRSARLEAALRRAELAGVLVVASAGNDGRDLGRRPSYPVCSPRPNVLGVAATVEGGFFADFSNRGSCVDLGAPGAEILSTARGGGTEVRSGTSQSAPQVAGAAAVLLARRPSMTVPELTAALRTAKPRRRRVVGGLRPKIRILDLPTALRVAVRDTP